MALIDETGTTAERLGEDIADALDDLTDNEPGVDRIPATIEWKPSVKCTDARPSLTNEES